MNQTIRCIVVDDEPIARLGMKRLISRHPGLEGMAYLESSEKAAKFLAENDIDLVFLDIQMPGVNGIDFARTIPEKTLVIFTTAYSEYAVDSYELDAVDYLLKPINAERFDKSVARAVAAHNLLGMATEESAQPKFDDGILTVKADRRYVRIKVDDIVYVEGLKDYIVIHTTSKKVVTRMKIKEVEEMLPEDRFMRINRSYIVNREAIDSFDNNDIVIGDREIAIGATYRDSVLSRLL